MTIRPRFEILLVMALLLVASWPVAAAAKEKEEEQSENKIRVAVMNFENNNSWHY